MNLIILSIPIFFLLIGLELLYQFVKKEQLYRLNDAVTNINCGTVQQITGIFTKALLVVTYLWVYNNFRIWTIKDTWFSYVILLLLVDFCYDFFHRYSHEIALLWGSHAVHHQSEEYNFSVALRQSTLQTFASAWFYLPIALIGFSFESFIMIAAIQTLYQFWIHTQIIKKLPAWFEYIFNTPSHHRVHHSSDPKYIDKNHGGTLIIWDRIFGTFIEEADPINYGVTKPVQSWNTLWVNFEYYQWLGKVFWDAKGMDKFKVLFKKTGWRPDYLGGPLLPQERPFEYHKYDASASKLTNIYVVILFVVLLGGVSLFLFNTSHMNTAELIANSILIFWAILNIGYLLESKSRVIITEPIRIIVTFLAFLLFHIESEMWIKSIALFISIALFMIYLTFSYINSKNKSPKLAN